MEKMELLAPAGDMKSAQAAFAAGADACYIGGAFSARAYAANFGRKEILQLVRYAHLRGKKVHVALNIMLKQGEIDAALSEAAFLYDIGVDAVIASDLGFIRRARSLFANLPLHASTQMGVQDAAGARLAAELGCSRVVAARESTLAELASMAETGIEVEAFCHGALCSGISGACLFSGMAGGRSGNRGRCAQPCRQSYELLGERAYHLSTKDLCAVGLLRELQNAGVRSLKIEGRMKRPEYVAIVTKVYREALSALEEGRQFDESAAREELKKIYNRGGFCSGYLQGSRDVTYLRRPGHLGVRLGEVRQVQAGRAILHTQAKVRKADGLEFRSGGASHGGMSLPYADEVAGGYRIPATKETRVGDEAFRTTDAAQMEYAQEIMEDTFAIPLEGKFRAAVGEKAELILRGQGHTVHVSAEGLCEAAQKSIEKERVAASLCKTGGTIFEIEKLELEIAGQPFLAASALNQLRREALSQMEQAILKANRPYEAVWGSLKAPGTEISDGAQAAGEKANSKARVEINDIVQAGGAGANDKVQVAGAKISGDAPAAGAQTGREGMAARPQGEQTGQGCRESEAKALSDRDAQHGQAAYKESAEVEKGAKGALLFAAQVQTAGQAKAALEAGAGRVYMSCGCAPEKFQQVEEAGLSVYLALPAYLDDAEVRSAEALLGRYSCFAGVLAGNLAGVALARKTGLPFVTDLTFNIASGDAANCLEALGAEAVGVSAELNLREISQIACAKKEAPVFGRIPVMHLRHCPLKKQGACGRCGSTELRDEKGYAFPLKRGGVESCLLEVLSSVPMAMGDLAALVRAGVSCLRLYFWDEAPGQVAQIIMAYGQARKTGALVDFSGMIKGKINKGHLERGVE